MDDVQIAKELAEALSEISEPFKHDAFRILLKYRLGIQVLPSRAVPVAVGHGPSVVGIVFPEFYRSLIPEPKTNPQRFAAVAFYYREYLNQMSVNQKDIVEAMQEAGLPPGKNFPRDLKSALATRNALLIRARDQKDGASAWQLSKTGEDFVRSRLQS